MGRRVRHCKHGNGEIIRVSNQAKFTIKYDSGVTSHGVELEVVSILNYEVNDIDEAPIKEDTYPTNKKTNSEKFIHSHNDTHFLHFETSGLSVYHLFFYFNGLKNNSFSSKIFSFKENKKGAVESAKKCIRAGIRSLNISTETSVVIPVPGSSEQSRNPSSPIGVVAKYVAETLSAPIKLDVIRKDPHQPLHESESTKTREKIISKANYRLTQEITAKTVYLVDDVYTTGTTVKAIRNLIQQKSPSSKVILLVLAKTSLNEDDFQRSWFDHKETISAFEKLWGVETENA